MKLLKVIGCQWSPKWRRPWVLCCIFGFYSLSPGITKAQTTGGWHPLSDIREGNAHLCFPLPSLSLDTFFCWLWSILHFTLSDFIAGKQPADSVCKLQRAGWYGLNVRNHIRLALPITLKSLNYILFTQSISRCVSSFLFPGKVNSTWRWNLRWWLFKKRPLIFI